MEETYYDILGVSKNATQEEIKAAYRKKAKVLHPDIRGDDGELFEKLNEANQTLSNEQKRKEYDTKITTAKKSNLDQIIESVLGTNIERDEYIKYLRENEARAKKCGGTLEKEIEYVCTLSPFECFALIFQRKSQIEKQLKELEERCACYDYVLVEYVNEIKGTLELCNLSIDMTKYKRGELTKDEIWRIRFRIEEKLKDYETKRNESIEKLNQEISKKGLDFNEYLKQRGLTEETIKYHAALSGIRMLEVTNKINLLLEPLGITIENYLDTVGKSLIELSSKEADNIFNAINTLKEENKLDCINDLYALSFSENSDSGKKIM